MIHRNREVSFNRLRDTLGLSDGNLGGHMQRLLDAGYVEPRHALVALRFELRYRLSEKGRDALDQYTRQIQHLLSGHEP